eukprot:753414-Hanusia_phi.AAC.8
MLRRCRQARKGRAGLGERCGQPRLLVSDSDRRGLEGAQLPACPQRVQVNSARYCPADLLQPHPFEAQDRHGDEAVGASQGGARRAVLLRAQQMIHKTVPCYHGRGHDRSSRTNACEPSTCEFSSSCLRPPWEEEDRTPAASRSVKGRSSRKERTWLVQPRMRTMS